MSDSAFQEMSYSQILQKDIASKACRPTIQLALTDMQNKRLVKMACAAGCATPGKLLERFVADLTGCYRKGADEENIANQWYQQVFDEELIWAFFRHFLLDCYPNVDEYKQAFLDDSEGFNALYDEYCEWGVGLKIEDREKCRAILNWLVEENQTR